MILRKITTEEIAAITLLIQSAENIGTGVWGDSEIHEAIKTVFESMPAVRAKDVDFSWMLVLMNKTKKHLEDVHRLSFEDDEAYATQSVPTISELSAGTIFEILASRNTDDDSGDLLDELESRFKIIGKVFTQATVSF